MIGQTLAHYRITATIGAGGMGQVYRATDTKLGREVALKVLPAEMAESPERLERFQREAKALAALDHPGIVTVHSVEEADGVHFLTMQLVEGQPLDKLIPEGGMPVGRIVEIATALAEALAAAHDKGIVHRDLKPANVMVTTDGRVKVLDFGLAKVSGEGAADHSKVETAMQTREGIVMGTVPYMSPEQVEGRRVDQRSDVFSLGVILYEMATGRRPFHSESTAGLMSAILRDDPQSPTSLRAGLPAELATVIERCLAKDPAARYPKADEVQATLAGRPATDSRIQTAVVGSPAPGSAPRRSGPERAEAPWIVVLPFKAQGADQDLAAFADGLGEDITTGLSRFSHLFVISRNSAMQYAGRSLDVRALGRELGARYALEGAARKAGSAVRVSVQLLDVETGTHLWAETYDRDLAGAGIFKVQDDVTDRVVATVADPYGVLVRSMAVAVRDRPVAELSAKELVLRVCTYWHQIRPDEHARLRTALERELEREPTHAEVWACLSRLYSNEHEFRLNPRPDSVKRALQAARRAVEINPTSQMGWEALAEASYFARDLGAFRNAAERAMTLNPRNTSTVALMGVLISHSGEWERGCEITRGAMALNPHHPGWYYFPELFDHYRKSELDQALETAKRLNMPGDFWVHAVTAAVCGRLGRREEARSALETLQSLLPGYRDELGPTLGLWILDTAVVEQVMEGMAEAEALVGAPSEAASVSAGPASRGNVPAAVDSSVGREEERGNIHARSGAASSATVAQDSAAVAIAVLPFSDMSPGKDQDYLCEGMAEEIMNALVRIEGIRVASRTSAFRASREEPDLAAIGRALSVDHVLEGSVRTAGSRLRVTAQLSDVASGYQLWSERFDRELEDVFAVQDQIASGVVDAVKARLRPGEHAVPARPQVRNLEAYRHYLKGRFLRHTKNDHGGALKEYEEAVRLDPSHGPSWVGVAEVTLLAACYGLIPTPHAYARAREALATAARLQGESANALYVEQLAANVQWRWAAGEEAQRRALELDPSHGQSLAHHGLQLSSRGRLEEAKALFERAREGDPLAAWPYAMTGVGLLAAGRAEESLRHFEDALAFEKENTLAAWGSGMAHVALGHLDEGLAMLETAVALMRRAAFVVGTLGWGLAVAGRTEEARALLEELRSRPQPAPTAVSEAWLLGVLGERDDAFDVLARAEEERQAFLIYTGLPGFDSLRDDPRFDALLGRMGLPVTSGRGTEPPSPRGDENS